MSKATLKGKKIGVLLGGLSEEREISLKTGGAVLKALLAKGYNAVAIDAGRDIAFRLVSEKVEVAFVALHGRYGEDGCIQGLLEVMGIPYTGSGVQASSVAMDKAAAKKLFLHHGVSTPVSFGYAGGKAVKLKLPAVVKPSTQGSAIGVTIVRKKKELAPAIELSLSRFLEIITLKKEKEDLKGALQSRKLVEKAKGLLMAREGLTEDEAKKRGLKPAGVESAVRAHRGK